jgi:hypothetical protein
MRQRQLLLISLYLLGLGVWGYWVWKQGSELHFLLQEHTEQAPGLLAGQDWVRWEEQRGEILAKGTHPLLSYKNFPAEKILPGDRLKKINYHPLWKAEVVENISRQAPPGKPFIYQVERPSPTTGSAQILNLQVVNGFRLAYSFHSLGWAWRLSLWLTALGSFLAVVILLILVPLFRKNKSAYRRLLGVSSLALLTFATSFGHLLFLIVEADLSQAGGELIFYALFSAVLLAYGWLFAAYRWPSAHRWALAPAALLALMLGAFAIRQSLLLQRMAGYEQFLENAVLLFFLLHLLAGLVLWAAVRINTLRMLLALSSGLLVVLTAGLLLIGSDPLREGGVLLCYFFFFLPLTNTAYSQIRFGKVDVVVTRALQYVVFIALSLFLYLAVRELFDSIMPSNPYRNWLELISLLVLLLMARAWYLNNERRFSQYFVTSQQQKQAQLKAFIASISSYTSAEKLERNLREQLRLFLQTDLAELTWIRDQQPGPDLETYFRELEAAEAAIWSRNKELADFRFSEEREGKALASAYSLIAPLKVSDEKQGLLLLGRKRKRVYNLSDLELISQLLQQTQLTLNVLELLKRERELVEKSYEANLTALRSQINPHFLFNTLNTISSLIHDSPDLAEEAVEKLAFIFRYTLRQSSQNLVSLTDELRLVGTYLEIEKIRFGDRLQVQIESEEEVRDQLLPAFVIQTLVENCVKHGIAKVLGKGIISIDAYGEGDFLVCEVYDNGPGIEQENITRGTGLNNIIDRMEKTYGMKNLLYFENTGAGTLVTLKVPLSQKQTLKQPSTHE